MGWIKNKIMEFIKESIILLAFILSAFWIIGTGITLLPKIVYVASEGSLFPFIYTLGSIIFPIMIMYFGLKYLKVFDKKHIDKTEPTKERKR